jgi:hypothetical protein
MAKIDLTVHPDRLERVVKKVRERNIIIPTFAQMKDPAKVPAKVRTELGKTGLWDVAPRNLFRITWHNEPVASGGGFGGVNYMELPKSLTGVDARIVVLVGKWFPTGAHKVGAAFGCLVPRLVTGQFDPTTQKSVWPSTGNFCRGGAYDSALLATTSIAILPEGMSRERFEWLSKIAGEVIAKLWVSSSAPDTDFTAKLVDVWPDGYAMNLVEGQLRMRYRDGQGRAAAIERGSVYEIGIPLGSTAVLFQKGHRVRLDISSSNFPKFEPNPNTGEPPNRWTRRVSASNTVHYGGPNNSRIELPAVPAPR